ncbi:MAG TPA: hypothetical protein VGY91_01705 [Chthoniobacterales bacterium]|jgi:hypothetical protein|nr:hypothetical protein [Chthoniobacterales bacterium]
MAGKTGLVFGFLHDAFIHIPIEMLVLEKKQIDRLHLVEDRFGSDRATGAIRVKH